MTNKDYVLSERRKRRLSFVLLLVDDYTKISPKMAINVFLKGRTDSPIKIFDSYHIFQDLPTGEYVAGVTSDYYFDCESKLIKVDATDPPALVRIVLNPKPSYPFPFGETLLRGIVGFNGSPLSGAKMTVNAWKTVEATTSEKGEFAVYFGRMTDENTIEDKGSYKYFVKGNDGKKIKIEIINNGNLSTHEIEKIELGKTYFINIKI